MRARLFTRQLFSLNSRHINTVVESRETGAVPAGEAAANIIPNCIGYPEQQQSRAKTPHEPAPHLALIYPERVVDADNRQPRSEQTAIDRLEAMGYTEMKLPPTYHFAHPAYGIKLQPADVPAMALKEDDCVRRRAPNDRVARRTGQIYRADFILRSREKRSVLTSAIQERSIVAVTELQHPGL